MSYGILGMCKKYYNMRGVRSVCALKDIKKLGEPFVGFTEDGIGVLRLICSLRGWQTTGNPLLMLPSSGEG